MSKRTRPRREPNDTQLFFLHCQSSVAVYRVRHCSRFTDAGPAKVFSPSSSLGLGGCILEIPGSICCVRCVGQSGSIAHSGGARREPICYCTGSGEPSIYGFREFNSLVRRRTGKERHPPDSSLAGVGLRIHGKSIFVVDSLVADEGNRSRGIARTAWPPNQNDFFCLVHGAGCFWRASTRSVDT